MVRLSKPGPRLRNHVEDSDDNEAGPSDVLNRNPDAEDTFSDSEHDRSDNGGESGESRHSIDSDVDEEAGEEPEDNNGGLGNGMDLEGFSGPEDRVVKPLTPEALAAFKAAKERTGVIYISRIPPGMRPTKVRYLMSQYGEVGKVYLQQEGECTAILFQHLHIYLINMSHHCLDAKRAYLRRKYTSTKKPHFTEGWVEFKDKKVARSVATMLNATPIGGKKGTRFRDDVWTMKYLPKFKWDMLTEQIGKVLFFRVHRFNFSLTIFFSA